MKYRADIDGLRCIAIVPVVLFHAGLPGFSGGFVGVDVFFVISGFLITNIIYVESLEGRFTFADFYDRRVRRLFPALFFMLVIVTIAASMILIPTDLVGYARSLAATSFFVSNVYFWQTSGYFAEAAEVLPLLHTWSLAVEEQFYLFFPPLLLVLLRLFAAKRVPLVLVAGFIASFGLSAWGVSALPGFTFYMLPMRAWELLTGALLAVPLLPRLAPTWGRLLAAAGVAMIALAVVAYEPEMPFPGPTALLPCFGAAFIIYGGMTSGGGVAKRMLEWRPVVFVGHLSYSLYLWHWPILVLAHIYAGRDLSTAERLILVGIAVLFSIFSLFYVEAPFRKSSALGGRRTYRLAAGAALIGLAGLAALAFDATNGLPGRVPSATLHAEAAREDRNPLRDLCLAGSPFSASTSPRLPPVERCLVGPGAAAGRYEVVVWGDSHADTLVPAVAEIVASNGWTVREIAMRECPPLLGAQIVIAKRNQRGDRCAAFNARALEAIRSAQGLKMVVIAGRWSVWTEGGENVADARFLVDDDSEEFSRDNSRRVFRKALERTVAALSDAGVETVVFGQAPEFDRPPWRCAAYESYLGSSSSGCASAQRAHAMRWTEFSDRAIREIFAQGARGAYVLPADAFCDKDTCVSSNGDKFFYFDSNHMSSSGARFVLRALGNGIAHN